MDSRNPCLKEVEIRERNNKMICEERRILQICKGEREWCGEKSASLTVL